MFNDDWNIDVVIWSVMSFFELYCEVIVVECVVCLGEEVVFLYVEIVLCVLCGFVVVVMDYVCVVLELICVYVLCCYVMFGIDGFGWSDLCWVLCEFFEVDCVFIVIVVLKVFVDDGELDYVVVCEVVVCYGKYVMMVDVFWMC